MKFHPFLFQKIAVILSSQSDRAALLEDRPLRCWTTSLLEVRLLGMKQSNLFDTPVEGRGEFMTTAEISERLITYGNIKKPMALSKLGTLLGRANFKSKRVGKERTSGWIVYEYSQNEIESRRKLRAK